MHIKHVACPLSLISGMDANVYIVKVEYYLIYLKLLVIVFLHDITVVGWLAKNENITLCYMGPF